MFFFFCRGASPSPSPSPRAYLFRVERTGVRPPRVPTPWSVAGNNAMSTDVLLRDDSYGRTWCSAVRRVHQSCYSTPASVT
jgi:hypothetical protein